MQRYINNVDRFKESSEFDKLPVSLEKRLMPQYLS